MSGKPEVGLSQRLYLIQNDVYHYHTGRLSNGNQVLMDEISRVEFDAEGNLLAAFCRETSQETMKAIDFEGNVLAVFSQETAQSSSTMPPFTPGTIFIKPFFLPEVWIGIRDLPDHYQEFVDQPEKATEEERLYYPEEIAAWRERNDFVLWWNEDYYLNEDGELESS